MLEVVEKGRILVNKIPKIKAYLVPGHSESLRKIIKEENVLGVINFSSNVKNDEFEMLEGNFPKIHVEMRSFLHESYYEIWTSENDVSYGSCENLQYATDGFHHFVVVGIREKEMDLREIGSLAYDSIFDIIDKNEYPNISRVWNFIPNINEFSDDTERYIKFCHGRADSFEKNRNIYPAATGIGCWGDTVCIGMISTLKNVNKYIENPNQTPAYKYPPKYGIKPPSFARATYIDNGCGGTLYVSGTASIIGHDTAHPGNAEKQCETTIDNIRTLISSENLNNYGIKNGFTLHDLDCIKVYIKYDEHFEIIRDICSKTFSSDKSIAYLKADICRKDLLVEIEGVVIHS